MKRFLFVALMILPLVTMAQTKIKETDVPKSVLLTLEKTYESYKVLVSGSWPVHSRVCH